MDHKTFKAMVVSEQADGSFSRRIAQRTIDDLPEGEVLVRVHYSSLNYKDALSATGNKGVTRQYPHTPGIDAAGVVEQSTAADIQVGEKVIVTSYDLGMNTSGGFAEYIRVPASWVVPLPAHMTLKESMIYGTAGFTAGLSINALIETVTPGKGEILVTGTSGGVGSMAIAILARLGYSVVAATGKMQEKDFFTALGAEKLISRDELLAGADKPILKARWAGVIDTVGGEMLANAIKSTHPGGTITCCGLAASPNLPLTVIPFILRGVRLQGIDSQHCPMALRFHIWNKLAAEWKPEGLSGLTTEIGLKELDEKIKLILQGKLKGRTVVKI